MTSPSKLLVFAGCLLFVCPGRVSAEKLQITSTPPGAAVELDGVATGTTPFEKDFPGGYFHKTRTALGTRLEHAMVARISLTGYDDERDHPHRRADELGFVERKESRRILAPEIGSLSRRSPSRL